jgi:hypothetical protein
MIMMVRPKHLLELDEDKWQEYYVLIRVMVMMFNATFNNISVISWWVRFIGGENH